LSRFKNGHGVTTQHRPVNMVSILILTAFRLALQMLLLLFKLFQKIY